MNGLTSNEIERRQDELYYKYYAGEVRDAEHLLQPWTEEDKTEMKELSFRSWVNSCLIYGCDWKLEAEELNSYDSCIGKSTLTLYEVELDRALEIVEEQKERFKAAKVNHNVYTDSEGCTYNSVNWN